MAGEKIKCSEVKVTEKHRVCKKAKQVSLLLDFPKSLCQCVLIWLSWDSIAAVFSICFVQGESQKY